MISEKLKKTLMGSTVKKEGKRTRAVEQRRRADELWCEQVDAAAEVEAVVKVDRDTARALKASGGRGQRRGGNGGK